MKTNNKAFTIIELLVVIAIIGLISSVVLVSMKGSTGKAKIAKSLEFSQTILNTIGVDAVGVWSFDEGSGGTAFDKSGYGNHGTITGATFVNGDEDTPHWYVNEGQGRYAFDFDGNDYVKINSDNFDGQYTAFTIEFWINTNTDTPTTYGMAMHRNNEASIGGSTFFGGVVTGTNELVATIGASSGVGWAAGRTGVIASSGRWYHVVCSWDGTTARTYVNGSEEKSYTLLASNFVNKPATTRFGASADGGGYLLNGMVDEVRIYERALGSSEIQQHYADGVQKHQLVISDN